MTIKQIAVRLGTVLVALSLAACAGTSEQQQKMEDQNSGFLKDYSKLTLGKDAQGNPVRTWVSPKLTPANYNAILLEPLIFYPEPRPTEKVSADALNQMVAYANETLRTALGKRFVLVDKPQPGAVRLKAAISAVASENEGRAPYQYVPIALIATTVSRAATGSPQRAFIVGESQMTDSVSGELLGQRVKVFTGEGGKLKEVGGKDQITLDTVKPVLDGVAASVLPNLEKFVKPKQ